MGEGLSFRHFGRLSQYIFGERFHPVMQTKREAKQSACQADRGNR